MKESRRHRWVSIENYAIGDSRAMSVCRDCGLELFTSTIKVGGHGICVGKAYEHQRELALISGDPQSIGNQLMSNALLACAGCGKPPNMMLAHRNVKGEITGWLFTCGLCFLSMRDREVIFRLKSKEGSNGGED